MVLTARTFLWGRNRPACLHNYMAHTITFLSVRLLHSLASRMCWESNRRRIRLKRPILRPYKDIRDRSVILIGAYNNLWTMRLIQPLRFNFRKEGTLVWVADTRNPQDRDWAVDYTSPYSAAPNDYAIVARYIDPTTGGGILMIAGIGAYRTEAASESAATPHAIEKLLANVPGGWENKNLEMVIKTSIINGEAGPPSLVSFATW